MLFFFLMTSDREKQTDQSKTKDSFFLSASDNALVLIVDLDTTYHLSL